MSELNAPYFLVALPQMEDPNFARAVVLIGHHDEEGAFGLILNRPLKDEADQQTQMTAEVKDLAGNTLFIYSEDLSGGGPLGDGAIFAVHEVEEFGSEENHLGKDLYLSNDTTVFQRLLEKEHFKSRRRFFMGYASWSGGQLESEIRAGAWLLVPYNRSYIFDDKPAEEENWSEHFWRKVLLQSGVDPLTLVPQSSSDSGYN